MVPRMPKMEGPTEVDLAIAQGASPWLLTGDDQTVAVEVLQYHDMPLAGVVRQDGLPVLYQCVIGHVESIHLWHYAPLTEEVLDGLLGCGPDDLAARLADISHLPGALALATDHLGIVSVRHVDPQVDIESPIRALYDELKALLADASRRADVQRVTAEMAFA